MSQNPPSRKVTTIRLGCRELEAGAQTCVYTGLICINTTQQQGFGRPNVIFVNDTEEDNAPAASDRWCQFRHQSSDPRYFSSRHWPILNNTFSPQRSCLDARFRQRTPFFTELNVFENPASVKWVPDISLVDLDYISNAHNNHLLKDIIWLLDTNLWQASVLPDYHKEQQQQMQLFKPTPTHIYLPQGLSDFLAQTSVDVNRLLYAIVLRLDPKLLYPNETLSIPTAHIRKARPLLDAYPHLKDTFLFHREQLSAPHAAVCAPRFTVGAKIGNGAHERVCRHIRRTSHALFGVKEPEMQRLGQVFYPRPPRRVVVLQRHITRSIANLHDLERGLRGAFEKRKVEVVIASTSSLKSAEDQVRFFGNVGVLITPHGSQSMGQIWMPRHR